MVVIFQSANVTSEISVSFMEAIEAAASSGPLLFTPMYSGANNFLKPSASLRLKVSQPAFSLAMISASLGIADDFVSAMFAFDVALFPAGGIVHAAATNRKQIGIRIFFMSQAPF